MKKTKMVVCTMLAVFTVASLTGCRLESETNQKLVNNITSATQASAEIVSNQPAPTDLDYSLERYNLIRRAYWVNGQREKANTLVCAVVKPLGYVTLFADNGSVVGQFVVDGKVSSLGSYLFPANIDATSDGTTGQTQYEESFYRTEGSVFSIEVPGIDGAYGSNVQGVFFFTPDGKYLEWTGAYLYSDIPFEVEDPVVTYEAKTK